MRSGRIAQLRNLHIRQQRNYSIDVDDIYCQYSSYPMSSEVSILGNKYSDFTRVIYRGSPGPLRMHVHKGTVHTRGLQRLWQTLVSKHFQALSVKNPPRRLSSILSPVVETHW